MPIGVGGVDDGVSRERDDRCVAVLMGPQALTPGLVVADGLRAGAPQLQAQRGFGRDVGVQAAQRRRGRTRPLSCGVRVASRCVERTCDQQDLE